MKTLTVILLCLLAFSSKVYTQNSAKPKVKVSCSISGKVIDSAANAALPYVTIIVLNQEDSTMIDGAITKNQGDFIVNDLQYGLYKLQCSFMGYHKVTIADIKLTPENPKAVLPNILLRYKEVQTKAVEINADKDVITYNLDKRIINISENPNAQGGTVADALQNLPSISVSAEGKVALRGSENFQALIDGKPSTMSGGDLLRTIPASAVESVEIITNPSAKYDPDGTAGIINIALRKNDLNGMNGIINGSIGNHDKYTSDATFNYRLNDLNYYGAIMYNDMTYRPTSTLTRTLYNSSRDTSFLINPSINRKMANTDLNVKAGIEYTPDPSRLIAFSVDVYKMDFQRMLPTRMREWSEPASINNYFCNDDDYRVNGYYITTNLFFKQKLEKKGDQLSSNLNVIIWDGNGSEESGKSITDHNFNRIDANPALHKSNAYSRTLMLKYKADYTFSLYEKFKLETGYNFDYTQDFSDYLFQDYDNTNKAWEDNSHYSNNTKYFHSTNALYGMFSGELWSIGYQFGLRAEYFNRRLGQSVNSQKYKYNKINFFPSFHISHNFSDEQQFQISYSRRVQRPDVYALNPFPDYIDDYIVSIGNPNLMPEFTDSYEVNYVRSFDFIYLSAQGYYRHTDNALTRVLRIKENNQLWITSENVSTIDLTGAELAAYFTFFKKLKINISANCYRLSLINHDKSIEESMKGNVLDGNIRVSYPVTPTTLLQLNTFYIGPQYTVDGKVDNSYSVGFSAKQFLFDRKLTIFLNGRNILNSVEYRSENRRENYRSLGVTKAEGHNYSIGFSLNLNNYEKKERLEDTIERTNVGSSGGY